MNQLLKIIDQLSAFTGYAALRVPLPRARHPGEVTLAVPGYRQVDSYSCGAVAVAMVGRFFRPRLSFERCYAAVNPHPQRGAGTQRVIRALRSLHIRVSHRRQITFHELCTVLDAGQPVLVCVRTNQAHIDHWVVLYGYGHRPNLVFVAGQGLPWLSQHRIRWVDFRRQWATPGEGLVCSLPASRP